MIEVRSFARILAGTGDGVTATFYADGEVADPASVTVDIARADGTVLASARPADGTGAAPRAVSLTPAETADLDLLTLTWHADFAGVATDLTTDAEIVGAHLWTIAEARAFDKRQLADATAYPEVALEEARGRIADSFALICGMEFIPRYRRATLDGGAPPWLAGYGWAAGEAAGWALQLPDTRTTALRAVETRTSGTATWATFGPDELVGVVLLPEGLVYREAGGAWPRGHQNVRVAYECGFRRVPGDIKEAALVLAVNQIVPRDIGDRALSLSTEVGTFRLATAGERGAWFGFPRVDSVLQRYARLGVPQVA